MIQTSVLDNGIRVITERIPAAHSASLGFWVENGARHESVEQNGISHFLEHMLFKGTRRRNALEIAKEIDSVGGILNAFTSREYSCFYAKVLARKLPVAIDLLSDIVLDSVFDPDEIEKERRVILQEIHMQEDTPDDQIHDLFSQRFWYHHPLGYPVLGTEETVGRISRDTLLGLLETQYCGRNILVCAAGDLQHQQVVKSIAGSFSHIPAGRAAEKRPFANYRRSIGIEEKELEQVHFCLGTRALPQNDPRRYEAYLLNTILGGSMSSRLFQKVREEQGLAYSIYSYLNCHSDAGSLVVYAGSSPDDLRQVVRLVLAEFRRLRDEAVPAEELKAAREQLKGNLLLSMESTDNRMTRLAKNEIYLQRQVSLKEVIGSISRVGRDQVKELAEQIFRDEFLNLQVIGRTGDLDLPSLELTLDG